MRATLVQIRLDKANSGERINFSGINRVGGWANRDTHSLTLARERLGGNSRISGDLVQILDITMSFWENKKRRLS